MPTPETGMQQGRAEGVLALAGQAGQCLWIRLMSRNHVTVPGEGQHRRKKT